MEINSGLRAPNVGALIFFGALFVLIGYIILVPSGLLKGIRADLRTGDAGTALEALVTASGTEGKDVSEGSPPPSVPFSNAQISVLGGQAFTDQPVPSSLAPGVYVDGDWSNQLKSSTGRKWPNVVMNRVPQEFDLYITPVPSDWSQTLLVDYDLERDRPFQYGNQCSLDTYEQELVGNGVWCRDVYLGASVPGIVPVLIVVPETYCLAIEGSEP